MRRGLRAVVPVLVASVVFGARPAGGQSPVVGGVAVVRPEPRTIVEPPLVVVLEGTSAASGGAPALVRVEIDGQFLDPDGTLRSGGGVSLVAVTVEVAAGERVRIEVPELEEGPHRLVVRELSAGGGKAVEVTFTLAGGGGARTVIFLLIVGALALGFALIGRRLRFRGRTAE
ncbi:MAG: hypothetical protein HY658_02365 [Actinobacteria bacterium]|nr:hypothetical protein [Actinomycetota bacterium]